MDYLSDVNQPYWHSQEPLRMYVCKVETDICSSGCLPTYPPTWAAGGGQEKWRARNVKFKPTCEM